MLRNLIHRVCPVLLVASLLLLGCGKEGRRNVLAPNEPPPIEYGDPSDLVYVWSVTPQAIHAGETIDIKVGITNPTSLPIVTDSQCYYYTVTNAGGQGLTPVPICCFSEPTYTLKPGEAVVGEFKWNGMGPSGALPAGDYRVYAAGIPNAEPVAIQILAP